MEFRIVLVFAAMVCIFSGAFAYSNARPPNVPPALYVFGDSLADAGNNNYIPNTPARANIPPYGETFFHYPTGRFCNGRTVFDFIATLVNIPLFPPPFLEPGADFSHGINFASGGSGLLDSTHSDWNIIPLSLQIRQFVNVSSVMAKTHGADAARSFLSKSLYAISIGANDLAGSFQHSARSLQEYVEMLARKYDEYVRSLHASGARYFVIVDTIALGCSPQSRVEGQSTWKGKCVESQNQLIVAYIAAVKRLVNNLNHCLRGAIILHAHNYGFVLDILRHGRAYGFSNTISACCGSGPFNAAVNCGIRSPKYRPFLCKNPDEYVFWDGSHPTERVQRMISNKIWSGNSSFVSPFNLKTLVNMLRKYDHVNGTSFI